jgi:hypothetical protein
MGSSHVFHIADLEARFTLCTLKFDNAEEAQTFTDTYARACTEYMRTDMQLCAAAATGGV